MKSFGPETQYAIWQKWIRAGEWEYRVATVPPGLDKNDPENQHPFGPTFNTLEWVNKYRDHVENGAPFQYPTGAV
jgi:hypothetical protein